MADMANIVITGRLGKDPVSRQTQSGDTTLSFSIGNTTGYGERKTTTWYSVTLFGKRADSIAPFLAKGKQVAVSGTHSLKVSERDGTKYYNCVIDNADVTLLGSKDDNEPSSERTQPTSTGVHSDENDIDPFASE